MGMPTAALGSIPRMTFVTSPTRLIRSRHMARRCPHVCADQRPTAAKAHATETTARSKGPTPPIWLNASRARGLSLHIGSNGLPGRDREMDDTQLIMAPTAKKTLRAVTPLGRVLAM